MAGGGGCMGQNLGEACLRAALGTGKGSMLQQKIWATTKKNNSKNREIIQQRNEKDTVENVFNKK